MVDFGEETREHFEEPEVTLPAASSVGYYHTHPTPRVSSWRQNVQTQEPTTRHNLMESRQDFVQVKSDPENMSRFCNSINALPVIGTGTSPPADAVEDSRLRGQLLQEITRVAETFEPYNNSSISSNYRSYNLAPDASQTAEADYVLSDAPNWMWTRGMGDDRSFSGTSSNNLLVGSLQVSESTMTSLQYPISSQLGPDSFTATLPSFAETEPAPTVPTSNAMQMQRLQQSTLAMSSSALDLSPASLIAASSLLLQASHVPSVASPSPTQPLLPSQTPIASFDTDAQQQQGMATYPQNLEENLVLATGNDDEDEENPDDVAAYPTEVKCNHCGAVFTCTQHLKLHMKQCSCAPILPSEITENEDKDPPGPVVEEKPKRPQRHQASQRTYSCKHCSETFSRPERLKVHELNHSGERPFRCNECSASFNTKTMLARHKKIHTGEKPYSCGECKTSFTESGSLKVHMRLHTGDRPYKCEWCDEAFSGAGMLASHKRKHTGEKPYVCNDCGASFRLLSTLKSHSRRHTGEKPFSCDLCGNSFSQKAALRRHKRMHLNLKPHECEHCGFKFREKENLRRHYLLHKIKFLFVCDICGAGFNNSKKLDNHKMLHNGGDKPYQCNKCPSSFASPKYLTQHKKRVHDRKGSIRCEECNATFNRRETLRSHLRIHKGAGQFVCGQCGAAFNQRATLTRHVRIHGEKVVEDADSSKETFSCRLCKTEFTDKASLDSHVLEHRVVEDFAYECPSCHLGFSDQLDLVKHKRTHHPSQRPTSATTTDANDDSNEPMRDKYICEDCDQTFFRKRQLRAHRKYCLCRDLDAVEDIVEVKPNVNLQSASKEVNAMKLVSAALAAAGDSTSEITYQAPPSSETSVSCVPMSTASTSAEQVTQRYASPPVGLSHGSLYEEAADVVHQELSYHQTTPESLLHHSANLGIMQSLQESLQSSVHDHMQEVERQQQPHNMQGETQGTISSQHVLREDMHHHHHHHHQPFDFDISHQEFYKAVPPQQQTSHHHHHQLGQHYDHPDSNRESPLLQNSVLQSISEDLEGCEDLHASLRHSDNLFSSHRDFRECIHQQREDEHRLLRQLDEELEERETDSFHQPHEGQYQSALQQQQFHSYNQYRHIKIDEKYGGSTDQHENYILQDQSSVKVRNSCPKSVGSYVNMRSKY